MNCPLCGLLAMFTEDWHSGEHTVIDYHCPEHLIQIILPQNWLTVILLNEDGDELYMLHFDATNSISRILDGQLGNDLDLEGSGTRLL